MSFRSRCLLVTWILAGFASVSPVPAQAPQMPDCTGISDVSDYDGPTVSDFDGQLTTVRVASGLNRPVWVGSPPDRADGPDDRLFILEKRGTIRILDLSSYQLLPDLFLDIQASVQTSNTLSSEEGLLGLAFHPDYHTSGAANEGVFFVYYTNNSGNNQVSRFSVTADPNDADESSEDLVIEIAHPTFSNHNGGPIAFGSDEYLYVGTGDGGSGCDPFGAGQNRLDLRGKILRLDVNSLPYSTAGNPYDGSPTGLDEVWSYGLRNPWRISFDRATGALYIGDVGQNEWEEINCQPSSSTGGENYGWLLYEGNHCPNPSCGGLPNLCDTITHTRNIVEYDHTLDGFSCAVVSGYVYRGCRMSDLHGHMYFADNCSNNIRTFRTAGNCSVAAGPNRTADLDPGGGLSITRISSFGEDSRGEIYICDQNGEVFKVLPELTIMEVSGRNAPPLQVEPDVLGWEDLRATSGHDITAYKVYRSDNDPTGPFECVFTGAGTSWAGGDPDIPLIDGVFYYLVTALNGAGAEARPGNFSDGTARTVDTLSVCP